MEYMLIRNVFIVYSLFNMNINKNNTCLRKIDLLWFMEKN
jgi:hypothetical protein